MNLLISKCGLSITILLGSLLIIPRLLHAASEGIPVNRQETTTSESTLAVKELRDRRFIYPNNWGQAGTFRVRSAESLPAGSITFGIGGEFYAVNNAPQGVGTVQANTISESLFVGWAPTEQLTISVARKGSSTTFGNPQQLVSSLGDFNFSALYSFPISSHLAIAPLINILIASNFNSLSPTGATTSVGGGFALSYGFDWLVGLPLFAHANIIYHMPQIRNNGPVGITTQNFFNFSRFNTIQWSLAAEIKLGDFVPFAEFIQTAQLGSGLSFGGFPSKIGLGTRITPLSNKSLSIILGADIGLGKGIDSGIPFTPGYQILGQISYTVGVSQTERKHYYTTKDVNVVDRKFVIRKNIRFKVNSDNLTEDSKPLLDEIAAVIRSNGVKRLLIVGHTDSTHTEGYNLALSEKRSKSVKAYLVSRGIESDVLQTKGMGKRKPKASNLTEAGRAKNRRVEFFILE